MNQSRLYEAAVPSTLPVPQTDAHSRPVTVALLIETDGPGGAEVLLSRLAASLRSRGHRVIPVIPPPRIGWLGQRLADEGFRAVHYSLRHALDWRCVQQLARLFRDEKVDVVHAHEFAMTSFGGAAAALRGIPFVFTIHGGVDDVCRALRRRAALRLAVRGARAAVAVSESTRRRLIERLGPVARRIQVIPNGVPIRAGQREPTRRALGVRDDEVLILAVGNLLRLKGHRLLLEAVARLPERVPWRVVIAGGRGGEERLHLEGMIADRSLRERAQILLDRSDVPDLLAAADIFAMPSLQEAMPLALLEAMMAGVPAVASSVGGIPEIITDGKEALLVSPGEVGPLTAALKSLIEDPALRARLGAAARQRAEDAYSLDRMTDAYLQAYGIAVGPASRPE